MGGKTPNWTSFRKRIVINTPIAKLYDAWAIPGNLTQWFLEEAIYIKPDGNQKPSSERIKEGDKHIWKWNNWDFKEEGNVLKANGKDGISFTFGAGGNVHINLKEVERGTELELMQDEIPVDEESKMNYYVGCSTGWTFWLANLKAWLEHGITLHVKGLAQEETKDLVNS